MRTPRPDTRSAWSQAAVGAGAFVVLLWALEIIDAAVGHRLDQYGVQPREGDGLLGILFAPVLHAGWGHLAANTVPALVLLFLVLVSGVSRGLAVTAVIWVVGGVGVWLVAPSGTTHLGASVLIFGWLVYLMLRGFFTGRVREIALGVLLFVLYGGLLLGVLPGQEGISWQGHLFGAAGGALAAYALSERRERSSL
ncbi:rhomboid family intramembrane serine protease [Nocardioides lijunqiniae]|uniref:rhomboid family intramembrane serine protease n=1 Tax=Nocardioides lijunqiniae TaxID=2760832 RepID=UPI001877B5BD|nr:rhomboid family intramembrane serine protease [Nocardioides lijunqiniae]